MSPSTPTRHHWGWAALLILVVPQLRWQELVLLLSDQGQFLPGLVQLPLLPQHLLLSGDDLKGHSTTQSEHNPLWSTPCSLVLVLRKRRQILKVMREGRPITPFFTVSSLRFFFFPIRHFERRLVFLVFSVISNCNLSQSMVAGRYFLSFVFLTWAIPPTILLLTTTAWSSSASNAAFWAAFTRLSDALFTAFPAAWWTIRRRKKI